MIILSRRFITGALAALFCMLPTIAAADQSPLYQADPDISKGGFSLTLATCNDITSEFITRQCTLSAPAVGLIDVTSKGADNFLDLSLDAMVKSAGYQFNTDIYKILRIRMKGAADISGGPILPQSENLG